MRYPAAIPRDQAAHLLNAGARCADDPDIAARYGIGESERHAAEDRGAAIRPHDQQSLVVRLFLQRALRRDRYIVAEDHRVQTAADGLPGLRNRVVARHRDQRQVRVGRHLDGLPQGLRPPLSGVAGDLRPVKMACRFGERGFRGRPVRRAHRDDEIVRLRALPLVAQNSGVAHQVAIRRRPHHQGGFFDPGPFRHRPRDPH